MEILEWIYCEIEEFFYWIFFLGGLEGIFFIEVVRNILVRGRIGVLEYIMLVVFCGLGVIV